MLKRIIDVDDKVFLEKERSARKKILKCLKRMHPPHQNYFDQSFPTGSLPLLRSVINYEMMMMIRIII